MRTKLIPAAMALAQIGVVAAPLAAQTTLNVRDADIRAFIADAAKVTGRTFIIDSRVQGKVTVVTDRPLSRSEYLEVFLSTLRANNLVAVPTSNGGFRVQPLDNAATQPSRVGGSSTAPRNSYVTEIVRLRSVDASSALDTVRTLVSPQGSVTANRAGNSIVIVDFADNVRRLREVLRRLDTDTATTRVVTLKNAGAREIATALQALLGTANGQSGPGVSVVAVTSSNAVALRGDPSSVARLAAVAQDLDKRAQLGTEIKVIFLQNADAEQLLPVLQQLVGQTPSAIPAQAALSSSNLSGPNSANASTIVQPQQSQPISSGGGSGQAAVVAEGGRTAAVVTRFAGANAIVIAAPAEVQRQLAEVVRQLDTRREQVLVEAIVAEISDNTANQLGVQVLLSGLGGSSIPFASSSFSNSAPNLLTIAGAIGARKLNTTTTTVNGTTTVTQTNNTISDTLAQSAIAGLIGASGGVAGFGGTFGKDGKDGAFGAIINAVKSDTTSNLLQAPHIVTLDNQPAKMLVGQEVPVTTGQALSQNFDNAFRTVQRENVGIQLEVRPQVNAGGTIKLFLHQQVSSIAGPVSSDNSDLILNKREFETTLTVDDGQIAVIGGLLDDNERRTIEKIPVLGDIPGLGVLFRSKARARDKTNLIVFIRPTIIRSAEDAQAITERRYGYLRAQQGVSGPGIEPSIDELVRDYMGAALPLPASPAAGSIDDPRIAVQTMPLPAPPPKSKRR
jgi:general secretion pathway protein D